MKNDLVRKGIRVKVEGVHIYFEIELDEEQILAERSHDDLELMYAFMDDTFEAYDCQLERIDGKKRIYTRDVDNKDLGCLMMGASAVEKTIWFEKYACYYKLYIYDEEEGEMDTEENWLGERDILLRRSFRAGVQEIVTEMRKAYGDFTHTFFREPSGCSDAIKSFLSDAGYRFIEEDEFLLFHKKDLCEYRTGMRLISVRMERLEMPGITALICLMQKNELPDSVVVAFLKNTEEERQEIQKLVKLLKKAKKTFRTIVLDVTNTGWEEGCDYTVENCYLTQRMYKNLVSGLHWRSRGWKIIPEDRQMLKGILFSEEYFTTNDSRRNDCDYYRECGIHCFSFCLPVERSIRSGEGLTISLHRLGWYMFKLVWLAKVKI